ncbi:hypothetical protein [Streptomyces sp. NPDC001591]|uniref:hypothetical protein n=1 Tax=unclassified Streptomyces TaxID=2593676 RepID=UPI0036969BF8
MAATKNAFCVAAADWLASDRPTTFDAAALAGAEPAADWLTVPGGAGDRHGRVCLLMSWA